MSNEQLLQAISDMMDQKLDEQLEQKLDCVLDNKLQPLTPGWIKLMSGWTIFISNLNALKKILRNQFISSRMRWKQ